MAIERLADWLDRSWEVNHWDNCPDGLEWLVSPHERVLYRDEGKRISMGLEWRVRGGWFHPFTVIVDHTGEQHRVELRVDARSGGGPLGESGIWGRSLTLVNNVWQDAGGIWYGSEKQMKVMRIDQKEQIIRSKEAAVLYPVDVETTVDGWLAMLSRSDLGMPFIFLQRRIDLGGFVWRKDYPNLARVEDYLGRGERVREHPLWLEVKRIEEAIEARKRQEGLIR